MVQNKALIFKAIPEGKPVAGKHLVTETSEFDTNQTPPKDGVVVKSLYASYDPYMRGRMRDASIKSYSPAFPLGQPVASHSVAQVIKSASDKFSEGDLLVGVIPVSEYGVLSKEYVDQAIKLDNPYNLDPAVFIGALGMPGLTAYSSLYEIGQPKKGETIFISAASGAVGQLVGQLAKHEGLTVIGSVGSDDKLDFITKELKFDSGFNYKKEKAADALKRLAPNGIDIYYENVGGEQLEAALDNLNQWGRIVACGMVSQYSLKPSERYGVTNLFHIVAKRITFRGFIVGDKDFGPKYAKDHKEKVSKWIHDKQFIAKFSVTEGMDNAAEGFVGMLEGKNFGKAVLKIA